MSEPTQVQIFATFEASRQAGQRLSHLAGALKLLQDDVCLTQQPVQGQAIDNWVCVLDWLNWVVAAEQRKLQEALTADINQSIRVVR